MCARQVRGICLSTEAARISRIAGSDGMIGVAPQIGT
jgi:hypothetical protein